MTEQPTFLVSTMKDQLIIDCRKYGSKAQLAEGITSVVLDPEKTRDEMLEQLLISTVHDIAGRLVTLAPAEKLTDLTDKELFPELAFSVENPGITDIQKETLAITYGNMALSEKLINFLKPDFQYAPPQQGGDEKDRIIEELRQQVRTMTEEALGAAKQAKRDLEDAQANLESITDRLKKIDAVKIPGGGPRTEFPRPDEVYKGRLRVAMRKPRNEPLTDEDKVSIERYIRMFIRKDGGFKKDLPEAKQKIARELLERIGRIEKDGPVDSSVKWDMSIQVLGMTKM